MAGPKTIQRYPTGLLSLLGMQSSGDTPVELNQELQGVAEMFAFYLLDRVENFQVGLSFAAVGTFAPAGTAHIVPPGELWVMLNVGFISGALPVGVTTRVSLCEYRASNNPQNYYPLASGSGTVGEYIAIAKEFNFSDPRIWRPGDTALGFCTSHVGGNVPGNVLNFTFARLRI